MDRIAVMTGADRARAADWAAREGWNPGARDMDCFAAVDPDGFFAGYEQDEMIAAISVVNYDAAFAFLGFYIVRPDRRGQGHGLALWRAALDHAGDRVVGLDGVVDQQENYRKSGFDLAYRNIRYGGPLGGGPGEDMAGLRLLTGPGPALAGLDAAVFPAARPAFWARWLAGPGHVSLGAFDGVEMTGFATLRRCRSGYKIGPLVARDPTVASRLLRGVLARAEPGAEVFLDVPEPNRAAVALAEGLGMAPVFETARMYRGPAPDLALERVFGVTSFELG